MTPTDGWHAYDHYAYAFFAVAGTAFAVGAIGWLMARSRWAPWIATLKGVVPPFINIIGVLFGLTLAFLANDTWSAHDRAMDAVFKEADALRRIDVLADLLAEPQRGRSRDALRRYAQSAAAEWPLLAQRQSSAQVGQNADQLLRLMASPDTAAAGANVQSLLLQQASALRDERDRRIALSQTHVNPLKWLGMAFLGFLTLLSVAVVHAEQPRAAFISVLLFALAAAPTAAIVLIQGNPFQQPSAVSPAPLLAAIPGVRS